jgi:hypothetical protein
MLERPPSPVKNQSTKSTTKHAVGSPTDGHTKCFLLNTAMRYCIAKNDRDETSSAIMTEYDTVSAPDREVPDMELKSKLTGVIMVLAILAAAPVLAARLGNLPPVQTQNGITYMTGGVGEPESTDMRSVAGRYSLMMTFAQRNGDFLDDIKVDITDRQGNRVLDIDSGPILLVDLPRGWYKVVATFSGQTLVRTVDVRGGHRQLAYAWPNDVVGGSEFAAFEATPSEAISISPPQRSNVSPSPGRPAPDWNGLVYDNILFNGSKYSGPGQIPVN